MAHQLTELNEYEHQHMLSRSADGALIKPYSMGNRSISLLTHAG